MATFLDISGLSFFSSVFTFLLIFIGVYAILSWGKILGSNNGVHAIMAVAIAILFMFSKDAIEVINFIVPWFAMLFIGILLMLIAYSLFNPGANVFDLLVAGDKHRVIVYWIVILGIIIILIGLGNTYGQKIGPYLGEDGNTYNDTNAISGISNNYRGDGLVGTADYQTNVGATIFHPKVLGIIFILLLATFTIMFIAKG